jgi:hypothetical protein
MARFDVGNAPQRKELDHRSIRKILQRRGNVWKLLLQEDSTPRVQQGLTLFFTASSRNPSSLSSYVHRDPSGSWVTGKHSIDSMKSTAASGFSLLPVIEHSELLRGL